MPTTTMPMRHLIGAYSGQVSEGSPDALRVRTTTPITIRRDTDGTWLAYVSFDDARLDDDSASESVYVSHPAACQAFDALFELIADPITFAGCNIEPESTESPKAAD